MSQLLIHATQLIKEFQIGDRRLPVLNRIDLSIANGSFTAVMGPSGSGKSTLMYILGCLDRPTSGTYRLDGRDVLAASDRDLSKIRGQDIGFVFQSFNLIPALTVFENVELPFHYSTTSPGDVSTRVMAAIEQVGLSERRDHRPAQLSGGEMQRAAIARAVVTRPKIILADEPTGNLDSDTGREILELFSKLHREGATIILVTHDHEVASHTQKRIQLKDGRIVSTQSTN
ncbi:MAG: ABC transporter ATP-binding protein [Deltaproteobacteria bacterium]|nr:ABC transporter ATP-binding protein [Deltaproteobacteria bacterium]